jgi:hypothetical protein
MILPALELYTHGLLTDTSCMTHLWPQKKHAKAKQADFRPSLQSLGTALEAAVSSLQDGPRAWARRSRRLLVRLERAFLIS